MYLVLVGFSEVSGARENYAAASCDDKYYPKANGRSVSRAGTIDGESVEFRVTSSGTYATAATSGNNAYFRFGGKTYWILFDAGVRAADITLAFSAKEGRSPEANPLRLPAAPAKELERRDSLSKALKAKFSGAAVVSAAKALSDALAPGSDYFGTEEKEPVPAESEKA